MAESDVYDDDSRRSGSRVSDPDVRDALARGRVVARFDRMDEARQAFELLQTRGVDPGDISLAGRGAEEAQAMTQRPAGRRRADRRMLWRATSRGVGGGATGAIGGAIVGGIAVGILALVGADPFSPVALGVAVIVVLAAFGALLGVYVAIERSIGLDDPWEVTLEDPTVGDILMVVRPHDDLSRRRARETLEAFGIDVYDGGRGIAS